jgi:hypothetical protein
MTISGMAAPIFALPPQPEMDIMVQYCDNNLTPLGMIQWATINATLYYNAVGSWSVLAPYNQGLWDAMVNGDFIILVSWRGLFTFGGKCETPTYESSIPGVGGGQGSGYSGDFISISGGDFLQVVANRLAYPDPTKVWTAQLAGNGDICGNTPLESAIKYYVNRNVGPGAIVSRRHPLLTVAADQKRGPSVNYQVNFGIGVDLNLMNVVRALISQAYPNPSVGSMGVTCLLNAAKNGIVFDVSIPQNKTNISFSEELGNLTSISFSLTDPTCTDALVRGGATNQFISATGNNVTPWNKIEVFVDNSQTDDTNNVLRTVAAQTLTAGTFGPNMNATVTDTPYCIYGRDYSLGDIVTVEVRPAVTYTDIVSSVTLMADATQTPMINVVPTIGNSTDPTATSNTITNQLINQIKSLEKKLAALGR